MSPKINERKTLFIDPSFQTSFVGYLMLLSLPVSGVFFACYRYLFWSLENKARAAGIAQNNIFYSFVRDQRHDMDAYFSVAFISVFVLLIAFGLHFSNRIAGPIYRAKRHFLEIQRTGKIEQLEFRERDYFQELAAVINQTMISMDEKTDKSHEGLG